MDIFVGTQPLIYRALVRGDNYRDPGTAEVSEIRMKTIISVQCSTVHVYSVQYRCTAECLR